MGERERECVCMCCLEDCCVQDLDECLAGIPIEPEMIDAVRLARKLGYWIAIVSDANSYFIEHILKSYGIEDCFDCIHTNPAFFESGDRLRVKPFHSAESPHECCRCPVNMCKTKVLSGLQSKLEAVSVIYVGDGQGDVCPALSLSSADSVFARRGYSLHDYLTRPDVTCAARIYEWSNGADVKALVENIQ